MKLPLSLRLAVRELRSGKRGFWVFWGCLFLGVFAIAAVGSVSEASRSAISRDARVLLGGDAVISLSSSNISAKQKLWLENWGTISQTVTLRAMARNGTGDAVLVAAKGVDEAYPLYGHVALQSGTPLREVLLHAPEGQNFVHPAVVDALLLERLRMEVGDTMKLGDMHVRVADVLEREPDRVLQGVTFGPRVLLSSSALQASGLLIPGSLIQPRVRIRLSGGNDEAAVTAFTKAATEAWADAGWQVRPFTRAAPRIRSFLDRLDVDLMLIGLAALLVGGLGIAEAVRGYLESRISHIATMKCVGGSTLEVLWVYVWQICIIGAGGIAAGCVAGAFVPLGVQHLLQEVLPVSIEASIYWEALGRAALFGFCVILAFSMKALLHAVHVSPAVLFRGYVTSDPTTISWIHKGIIGFFFLVLSGCVFWFCGDFRLGTGFVVVSVGCFGIFRVVALGLRFGARFGAKAGHPSVRLGLSAIYRPGAPTESLVFALGLGLTALVAIAQIESNLTGTLERDLSQDAPAFFFINLLADQRDSLSSLAYGEGATRVENGPMIRGRISKIAGVPVEKAFVLPEARWAVRGDRGLTHSARQPENTTILFGEWWPETYSGPPIISLTADLAKGFGVTVGDTLTFTILGREVTATIANIRSVDWMTFQLQFAVVFAPGLLENAPVTWISTVYGKGDGMDILYRKVSEQLPNVSAFSMREILRDVQGIMQRMGQVFRSMATVMLFTGFFVLAGAFSADRHRRVYDAVIYKVCGATSGDILKALVTEFVVIGVVTGSFSALTGSIVAWAAVEGLMDMSFHMQLASILITIVSGCGFALLFGLAGTIRALKKKPAPYLRNE